MRVGLKERRLEVEEVISFVFDLGGRPFEYRPGQYAFCELDTLDFPDERGNRRHFTISSSPTEKGIVMFTTRMRGSGFKETLRHATLGYEINIGTLLGHFVMPEGEIRRHVFIAGGIGITPYRSMLRCAADVKKPIDAVMLYFSHSSADIVFRQELEEIARQMATFSLVHVLSDPEPGWKGEKGRLNEALLRKWVPNLDQRLFWISGPPPMVTAYKQLVKQTGVGDEAIRTDSFAGY
ncbi:MAG: FAD-dependent oxidoreductase [Thermodesulfobacteriota bacterium]